jgi:hypothetical protein
VRENILFLASGGLQMPHNGIQTMVAPSFGHFWQIRAADYSTLIP